MSQKTLATKVSPNVVCDAVKQNSLFSEKNFENFCTWQNSGALVHRIGVSQSLKKSSDFQYYFENFQNNFS